MLSAVLTASAQIETLKEVFDKADPMLGTPDSKAWISDHAVIHDESRNYELCLICDESIFKNEPIKVGFYDSKDNLLAMCDSWYAKLADDMQCAWLVENGFSSDSIPGSESLNKKPAKYMVPRKAILDYLLKGEGYVRFVTTAFGGELYDVRIAAIRKEK